MREGGRGEECEGGRGDLVLLQLSNGAQAIGYCNARLISRSLCGSRKENFKQGPCV